MLWFVLYTSHQDREKERKPKEWTQRQTFNLETQVYVFVRLFLTNPSLQLHRVCTMLSFQSGADDWANVAEQIQPL